MITHRIELNGEREEPLQPLFNSFLASNDNETPRPPPNPAACAPLVRAKLLQILPETRAIKLTYPRNSSTIRAPSHFAHIFYLLIFICTSSASVVLLCLLARTSPRLQLNSNFGHGRFFMLYNNPNDNCSPIWGQSFTGSEHNDTPSASSCLLWAKTPILLVLLWMAEWNQNLQNQRGRLI